MTHPEPHPRTARRGTELRALEREGRIGDLVRRRDFWFAVDGRQLRHANGRRIGLTADFAYVEGGTAVAEIGRGGRGDEAWGLRKALFRACFPDWELRER